MTTAFASQPALLSVSDIAQQLAVPEHTVRNWLSDFNWERRFDARGQLCFSSQDVELLALIRSLESVESSCVSLETMFSADAQNPTPDEEELAEALGEEIENEEVASDLEQVERLKAELRDLHSNRTETAPLWQFWKHW